MSQIWAEGFDHWITPATTVYNFISGGPSTLTTPLRTGPRVLRLGGDGNFRYIRRMVVNASEEHNTLIQGAAFYREVGGTQFACLQFLSDSVATSHMSIGIATNGAIQVKFGGDTGTVIAQTVAAFVPVNTWSYLEAKVVLGDAGVGSYEVRSNGITVIGPTTADTKNGGTKTVFDSFGLGGNDTAYADDWYVNNGAGSVNNGFSGDTEVLTCFTNADGTPLQFATTGSANHWDNVNEVHPSTADYNSGANDGDTDMYGLTDIAGSTGTIRSVMQAAMLRKTGTEVKYGRLTMKDASATVEGPSQVQSTSTVYYYFMRELAPAGGAWTTADVNGLNIGVVAKDS